MNPVVRTLLSCLACAALPTTAFAAGYDTPVLYSARHMGMGGTAIGYVDDPSSIFHNPAGLEGVARGAVLANLSPIMAKIHGSPSDHVVTGADGKTSRPGLNIWSETAISPAFLVAAGYRLIDRVAVGFSVYPVASAGGRYTYATNKGKEVVEVSDYTRLVFIDYAPAVSVRLSSDLSLGLAWRYSTAQFQRKRSNPDAIGTPSNVDLDMKGSNLEGFRLGLQWRHKDFSAGAVYRARTDTEVTTDSGMLENTKGKNIKYAFVLPAKFGFGFQYRGVTDLRLAFDAEYTQQSDNDSTALAGTGVAGEAPNTVEFPVSVPNISKWNDNFTLRFGAAYKLGGVEARAGYLLDGAASQPKYVSAFGTPPTETHSFTIGAGYQVSDSLDVSLAGAYRTGKTTVREDEVKGNGCPFCGKAGEYEIAVYGGYLDVCWRFGQAAKAPAAAPLPAPAAGAPAVDAAPAASPRAIARSPRGSSAAPINL